MKKIYIFIFTIVLLAASSLLIYYYYQSKQKQNEVYYNYPNPYRNNVQFPVGIIKNNDTGEIYYINGFIKKVYPNKLVLSLDEQATKTIEIFTVDKTTVYVHGYFETASIDKIVQTKEELDSLRKEGTFSQIFISESKRNDGEITYFADKAILFE